MKLGLQLMLFMESVFMFAGGLFGPLYAIYVTKVGGDLFDVGIASFLYFMANGIMIWLIGKWSDHYKHKENLYILGYFLSAWAFLGFMIIDSMWQLFALQIIQGIGLAISIPVRDALYTEYVQKGKEASQWSYWEFMASASYAVSALGGGYLASMYGFKTLFLFVFMMLILGVGFFTFFYVQHEKRLNKDISFIKATISKKPLLNGKRKRRR